jgi:hypothetical protein
VTGLPLTVNAMVWLMGSAMNESATAVRRT